MAEDQGLEPKLTVSQEFSVLQPGPQNAFLIVESDWKRIKRIVTAIVPSTNLYQIVASGSFGVLVSAASVLLSFRLSNSSPPTWAWITVVAVATSSLIATAAFAYFESQQNRATARSVTSVLDEIEEIEQNWKAPTSAPVQKEMAPKAAEAFVISSAIYGAGGAWREVAGILNSKISDGKLLIAVTNEALGGDPVPNVAKELVVTYSWHGRICTKRVAETGVLSLPEASV